MRVWFIGTFLGVAASLWSYPALPEPRNDDEALLIRRIVNFWKDKEYPLAQSQIKTYLKNYPQNPYSDHFWAMLGDMAMQSKAFTEALEYYSKISKEDMKACVQLKKWQALYQLGMYAQLYQEATSCSAQLDGEASFYFAESAFREALALLNYPQEQQKMQTLCRQALPFYETLIQSGLFTHHAKLAIAEIYHILNQPEKAAALYFELAEQDVDQQILFHAATVLVQCDTKKAGQIFKKIALGESAKRSEASFQWFLLLVQEGDWQTIERERTLFTSQINQEHLPLCYFYLGMLSFEKKLYRQAVIDLRKCVTQNLLPQYEKRAWLTLLASAGELKQWELCETSFDELDCRFPETRPEAYYLLASTYQKAGEITRALKLYETMLIEFPSTEFAEKASYEKIRLLAAQKKYSDAHNFLLSFLDTYPESSKKPEVIRLAINLSLTQLAEKEVYEQLAADLERGLQANLFYKEEKSEKELLLAKAYIKLGKMQAALHLLNRMETPDPFLLVQCYIDETTVPDKVVEYGEKALLNHPEEAKLRLHLFNAYLELAKEDREKEYSRKAADHLKAVLDDFPVSLENRLWLAHYFFKEEPMHAIPILESLIQTDTNLKRFDQEAIMLATLYCQFSRLSEAQHLLEKMVAFQPKIESQAKLKLAEVYAQQGKNEIAIAIYQKLEESAQLGIAYTARLQLARLDFASAPEKNLKKLYDLAMRKSLINEPIHLEAALDYADLKAATYPEEERTQRLLELLTTMKASFSHEDDVLSKDYHACRSTCEEKDILYQAYMRFFDARIYQLQARLAENEGDGKTKLNAARALFSTLRHGKYAATPYLKEKSMAGLYEN